MKFIKNYTDLLNHATKLRKDVLDILEHILNQTDPEEAIKRSVILKDNYLTITDIKIHLNKIKNIYVVGGGKASFRMAFALYNILGNRIKKGIISVNETSENKIGPIKIIKAGHPIPTQKGIQASKEIIKISEKAKEDDLLIALISGGGSALLPLPFNGITLSDLQDTNELLLASGANIYEINVVRKHLSKIKGGRLSASSYPANIISLIISDVVGDDLSSIASGPTAGDDSTFEDVNKILTQYKINNKVPSSIAKIIKKGMRGKIPETPGSKEPVFLRTQNRIILNNLTALINGEERAKELKYNTLILSSAIEGEAREVGILHAGIGKEIVLSSHPLKTPAIIFSGGETTVTLEGYEHKIGGPNQECAIGFMKKFDPSSKMVFLSIDSDGIDGNSNYAGGIIGGIPLSIGKERLSLVLERHATSKFLERIKGNIQTGATGTNVNDIRILGVGR